MQQEEKEVVNDVTIASTKVTIQEQPSAGPAEWGAVYDWNTGIVVSTMPFWSSAQRETFASRSADRRGRVHQKLTPVQETLTALEELKAKLREAGQFAVNQEANTRRIVKTKPSRSVKFVVKRHSLASEEESLLIEQFNQDLDAANEAAAQVIAKIDNINRAMKSNVLELEETWHIVKRSNEVSAERERVRV